MGNYHELSEKIIKQIEQDRKEHVVFDYACRDEDVIRKYDNPHDYGTVLRPAFVRDVEKIMHNPYYTRYADKTQVFSFIKNDDYYYNRYNLFCRIYSDLLGVPYLIINNNYLDKENIILFNLLSTKNIY